MNIDVSEEKLNAFIDDELDAEEKDNLFTLIETNPVLAHQVCELRSIKELVRHGHVHLEPPVRARHYPTHWFRSSQYLVAGLMMALGLGLGWMAHAWSESDSGMQLVQAQPWSLRPVSLAGVTQDMHKIVLHLDSAEPAKIKTLLDDVDYLTQPRDGVAHPVQVEVIASHYGLNMLRSDITPYTSRLNELAANHPNVVFVACNQTIQRLSKEGAVVKLMPNTRIAPTATEEIVTRLHGGWTYIKV